MSSDFNNSEPFMTAEDMASNSQTNENSPRRITLTSDKWSVSLCQGLESLRQAEDFCDVVIKTCSNEAQCGLKSTIIDSITIPEMCNNSDVPLKHSLTGTKNQQEHNYSVDNENCRTRSRTARMTVIPKVSQRRNASDTNGLADEIQCNCPEIKVHSVVLGASSSVLQEALKVSNIHYCKDKSMKIIQFDNISCLLWNIVLKFIYLGAVSVQEDVIQDLKNVAERLKLGDLSEAIVTSQNPGDILGVSQYTCDSEKRPFQNMDGNNEGLDDQPKVRDNLRKRNTCKHESSSESVRNIVQNSADVQSTPTIEEKARKGGISKKFIPKVIQMESVKKKKATRRNTTKDAIQEPNQSDLSRLELIDINCVKVECEDTEDCEEAKSHLISKKKLKCEDIEVKHSEDSLNETKKLHKQSRKSSECPVCGKKFKNRVLMKCHQLELHRPDNFLRCDKCAKTFQRKQDLTVHRRIHTGEKPYACRFCTKTFSQKQNMKTHEKGHLDEKNFECETCGRTFLRKYGLQEHRRTHTGEKPFLCQTCGKSFSKISNLQVHERIHSGVKPYSCSHCLLTFNDPSTLKQHMLIHQGCKMHQCSTCGVQFARAKSLREHERIHTGEKPHKCLNCNAAFANTSNLSRHRKCHHGEDRKCEKFPTVKADIWYRTPVKTDLDLSSFLKTPSLSDFSFSKLGVFDPDLLNATKDSVLNSVDTEYVQTNMPTNVNVLTSGDVSTGGNVLSTINVSSTDNASTAVSQCIDSMQGPVQK